MSTLAEIESGVSDGIGTITVPPLPGGMLLPQQVAALDAALTDAATLPGLILTLHGAAPGPLDPEALVPPAGLPAVVERIAASPVVAVLLGPVTGPSAAIALAARARVALGQVWLGWPEAAVALLPPAGALVRLAGLAGARRALDLADSGRQLGAHEALAAGVVDAVAASEAAAQAQARALLAAPPVRAPIDGLATFEAVRAARKALPREQADTPVAPARRIDVVEATALLPEPQALAFAAEAEGDAQRDPVGQALRHLARAERALGPALTAPGAGGTLSLSPAGMEAAGALRAAWVIAAQALLREGLAPVAIDAAACHWGHVEGPLGTAPPPAADLGIAMRLVAALLAESARLVEAGALATPAQADALAVMATGFPRWRGGPVYACAVMGQGVLARQMEGWARRDPVWALPDTVRHAILVSGHWGG